MTTPSKPGTSRSRLCSPRCETASPRFTGMAYLIESEGIEISNGAAQLSILNSPVSAEKVDKIISIIELQPNDRVLDVGCGDGEFLIRLLEYAPVNALGIDINAALINKANTTAERRLSDHEYEFRSVDIKETTFEPDSFAFVSCIGATHAFGNGDAAYPNTLKELVRIVQPGGQILVGEGYWKQTPDPDYLALLGEPVGIYRSHFENIEYAERQQRILTSFAAVSNDDEWDDFEWSFARTSQQMALSSANEQSAREQLDQALEWRNGYLRWGRDTMGFGFYLFTKLA